MQSQFYKGLEEESHGWLGCNIEPKKVSAILNMQEQMIEIRGRKKTIGTHVLSPWITTQEHSSVQTKVEQRYGTGREQQKGLLGLSI